MSVWSRWIPSAILLVSILVAATSPLAAAAASDCSFEKSYLFSKSWTFVCDAGWTDPQVVVEDLAGKPCVVVEQVDEWRLNVDLPDACIGFVDVSVTTHGTVKVWQ